LPPQHVRRNKTDRADAAALLEADHRYGAILPVPVKTVDQQGLQGLHRIRSAWMATRTDRLNTTRGLLREFGLDLPQGPAAVLTQAYFHRSFSIEERAKKHGLISFYHPSSSFQHFLVMPISDA
jgi:transposase